MSIVVAYENRCNKQQSFSPTYATVLTVMGNMISRCDWIYR